MLLVCIHKNDPDSEVWKAQKASKKAGNREEAAFSCKSEDFTGTAFRIMQAVCTNQERIIKRGGGRACNFRRFWTGQNNPPVLFIERSFAREILIAWHDAFVNAYARVRVQVYVRKHSSQVRRARAR